MSDQKEPPPSSDLALPAREDSKEEMTRVIRELRVLKMCTNLNLSYQKVPILFEELQDIDKNCIWNDIQIGETKARNIVVMGEGSREDIAAILRNNYFCICIDESTDIGKEKALAIIVRYINPDDGYVECKTWDMARLFEKGEKAKATAQRIFDCIKNSFTKYSIPITNLYTCCFDGCNTMIGERSGLKAILNEIIPNIICVQCPEHITHLCAQ